MKKYTLILIVSVLALILIAGCAGSRAGKSSSPDKKRSKYITVETSMGDIVIRLYNETPLHRDNMLKLVKEDFYEDLLFHRVIDQFMIQGGDPDSKGAPAGTQLGNGGPGYTVPAEFDSTLFHKKGVLAAARLGDRANPEKASSGSQFYIVVGKVFSKEELVALENARGLKLTSEAREAYTTIGGTPHLDGSYTVYGEVVEGLEVVEQISEVKRDGNNRPLEDIIFSISRGK